MRSNTAGLPQMGSPNTRMVPWLGLSWPVINFMNVDLPAPLGPSRPVMPCGIDTVTLLRPETCPYHLDTASAYTRGVVAPRLPAPDFRGHRHGHVTISTPRTRRIRITIEPAIITSTTSAAMAGDNW